MNNEIFNEKSNENNEKSNEKLTIDELRGCEGFESYTDKEAVEMVDFIYNMSVILYNHAQINTI